nr:MAG TPA: hypothetical protein [Caudoviricetes sp.]
MEKSLRALIIGFCLSGILASAKLLGVDFTWNFVLLPFLIPLSLFLALIINIVYVDGIDDIKSEMEKKRR